MPLSDELRATHRGLSELDLEFRESAREDPRFLDRSYFEPLNRHNELLIYRLQPWLTFLGRDKLADLRRVSVGVYNLLRTVPQRLFENDYQRISDFYGLGSRMIAEIVCTPPNGLDSMVSRGDLIDTADGFKCIEFNCSPCLGGWDSGILMDLHLSVPATAEFIAGHGVAPTYTNTVQRFFSAVVEDVRAKGLDAGGEINVAFVYPRTEDALDLEKGVPYLEQELRQTFDRLGGGLRGRVVMCRFESLVSRANAIYRDDLRVHSVVLFSRDVPPPVFRSFKTGKVSLFNGPVGWLLGDKRNLALLSERAESDLFDAEERELIRRHIPWTRLVTPGKVEFEGETVPLADLLRTRRERMVLKQGESFGGKAVVLGSAVPEPIWQEAVDKAMQDGRWVVQELQPSLPYLYQSGDYGCSVHDLIWGPFVFAGEYAGVILRMQPKAAGGAVNLSLAATEGVALEI